MRALHVRSAKDLVRRLLVVDPAARLTATQCLSHPWVTAGEVPRNPLVAARSRMAALSVKGPGAWSAALGDGGVGTVKSGEEAGIAVGAGGGGGGNGDGGGAAATAAGGGGGGTAL
jgi:hypothetical protein